MNGTRWANGPEIPAALSRSHLPRANTPPPTATGKRGPRQRCRGCRCREPGTATTPPPEAEPRGRPTAQNRAGARPPGPRIDQGAEPKRRLPALITLVKPPRPRGPIPSPNPGGGGGLRLFGRGRVVRGRPGSSAVPFAWSAACFTMFVRRPGGCGRPGSSVPAPPCGAGSPRGHRGAARLARA
jgi:hypothetical protein